MNYFEQALERLKEGNNLRSIPADSAGSGVVDLSGNDYLGLAAHASLKDEFFRTLTDIPDMSASASRLLAAGQKEFAALESLLADLYGAPTLLFNSGYHANSGAISALARERTLIVADKLVHASIIDGMVLSKAPFERFRHNDVSHLRRILDKKAKDYDRVLIVCESIYSMDGDIAPLQEIVEAKTPNSLLYVDEAHAFGVLGRDGLGLTVDMPGVDFTVGTLGKAAASAGAFIVCRPHGAREYLLNSARSFIFSTALPPINIAWSRFIIERIPSMDDRRAHLSILNETLGKILGIDNPSHIQPYIVGSSAKAIELSQKLLAQGFKVLPIRTPTVPPGTERLRFSLSATLQPQQLHAINLPATK